MKTIVKSADEIFRAAAETVIACFRENPEAVFTMAAGRTMQPLWELLGEAVREGRVSLQRARFFQTAEFLGAPHERSLRRLTEDGLLAETDLPRENCFWLEENSPEQCEEKLKEAGGLSLAVLGIGINAQIGLNEPATPYDSGFRLQKLTEKTKKQFSWLFGSEEEVPERGITMGIKTLCSAKKILVLASGEEKAKAVFDMLYARDDSIVPAAFLQLPFDVTVYADFEAGGRL